MGKAMSFLLFLFTAIMLEVNGGLHEVKCNIIQKQHQSIAGTGIFAQKTFKKGEVIEKLHCIYVDTACVSKTILDNYVYDSRDPMLSSLFLGHGMMFNHGVSPNILITENSPHIRSTRSNDVRGTVEYMLIAKRDIEPGEELLSSYGDNKWFEERGELFVEHVLGQRNDDCLLDQRRHRPGEVVKDNHCQNFGEEAGVILPGCAGQFMHVVQNHAYAAQFFEKGDIIEVVRALILPPCITERDTLYRYAWHEEHGSTAMILLGNGALYGATEEGLRGSTVQNIYNVNYRWFSTNSSMQPSWMNLVKDRVAFVAIIAARDIEINEELTVPLMVDEKTGQRRVFNSLLP